MATIHTPDAVVTPTQLHRTTGKLLHAYARDGGLIEVRDRWDEVVAVLVVGPAMRDVFAEAAEFAASGA